MAIQISLAALGLLVAPTIAYYCSARVRTLAVLRSDNNPPHHRGDLINNAVIAGAGSISGLEDSGGITIIELGLDEATLRRFPKLLYSVEHGKLLDDEDELSSSTAICCEICLADFEEGDVLRLLPDCGHIFHQKCVDPWLQLRPTCPNCRTSPIPTPIATPLAEVTPLALQ
ncbi:hypothetical protein TIFTF001_030085 [Ficus carica]|uniref:RING-type domain-containing protein n=1 Tax=Ficus carica TaxID=3494 RepID=A0AA88IZ34_FICCA|nr:hypothetical protein TIFTF001_030085 [Ficus carica]